MKFGSLVVMMLVVLAGLLGLFMASRAVDGGIYIFGLVIAAFAVLFNFWIIKQHFDSAEEA